ncbi:BRO-J [Helicoverpa armigera granulovirus]|uniref:BRO-J n=1 Tax=Helicoverpa armigera granulovirus TaxID=489830 RepID=A9YN01_9BBAC|nr:BRO-J [Helicoverpa armigera granulovirus]ABY47850.1 BRO-J [Helicoverpa armigera granulovirus]
MVANPFATVLKYNNSNKAIRSHVSEHNQKNYEDFKSAQIGLTGCVTSLPRTIQANPSLLTKPACLN